MSEKEKHPLSLKKPGYKPTPDVLEIKSYESVGQENLYPPYTLISSNCKYDEGGFPKDDVFSVSTEELDWLPDRFRNEFTDILYFKDEKCSQKEKIDQKAVYDLMHFYSENFPNSPKSKPSKKPIAIPTRDIILVKDNSKQKPMEYYKKQYLLYKRNRRIKQKLNKFHYDVLFEKLDFTNSYEKKKSNFFVRLLWNLNARFLNFVNKKNIFRTDSQDMIDAIQFAIEGKLQNVKNFLLNER